MTFSSNEAECIGGRHAVAGTKQKSWGLGGGAYIRDRIGWWRELCLKIDKEEKKGGGGTAGQERIRTSMHELDFLVSHAIFCRRAPI